MPGGNVGMWNDHMIGTAVAKIVLVSLYAPAMRVLILVGIFLFGYMEGALLKKKSWACATWFWGLAALTAWIVYPLTIVRICAGVAVFVLGLLALIAYYREASVFSRKA